MPRSRWFPPALLMALCVAGAAVSGPGKEPIVQGKPLSHWLKELKDPNVLAREEALLVLASAGEAAQGAAPHLTELLKDKAASIRVRSAVVLAQLKGHKKPAAPVLLAEWKEATPGLRRIIAPALGPLALENREILALLLRALDDADQETRFHAGLTINKSRPAIHDPLIKVLDDADPLVRRHAIVQLGLAGTEAAPALTRMLKDDDWDTRFSAARSLARIEKNPPSVVGVMLEANAKDDPKIRAVAVTILLAMNPPAKEALEVYKAALKDDSMTTKVQAAEAVWHLTRTVDDVLPVYRAVLETPAKFQGDPNVPKVLDTIKRRGPELKGPEAKVLRNFLLGLIDHGKETWILPRVPPVLAALGPESIPTLIDLLRQPTVYSNQNRREAVYHAMALLGGDGVPVLLRAAQGGDAAAVHAMQFLSPSGKTTVPALKTALNQNSPNVLKPVIRALASVGPDAKDAVADLVRVARQSKDASIRRYVLFALPHMAPDAESIRPLLNDALSDADPKLRLAAADWLLRLEPKNPQPLKIVLAALKNPTLASDALTILRHNPAASEPALPAVAELLADKNARLRNDAIVLLDERNVNSPEHRQALVRVLSDPDVRVRIAAARALRNVGAEDKATIACLVKAIETMPLFDRHLALAALAEFGPAAKEAIPAIERVKPGTVSEPLLWIESLSALDADMTAKHHAELEKSFTSFRALSEELRGKYSSSSALLSARLLGRRDPKDSKYLDLTIEQLRHSPLHQNRSWAAINLAKGGAWAQAATPALSQALEDPHAFVRIEAALALEKLAPGKHKALPVLIECLSHKEDWNARWRAAMALGTLGPAAADAVPALRAAAREVESHAVRVEANEALRKIHARHALPCVYLGN